MEPTENRGDCSRSWYDHTPIRDDLLASMAFDKLLEEATRTHVGKQEERMKLKTLGAQLRHSTNHDFLGVWLDISLPRNSALPAPVFPASMLGFNAFIHYIHSKSISPLFGVMNILV